MQENKEIVQKHCMNCEFCMANGEKTVCAGRNDLYGEDINKVIERYPNGCEEFEYTLNAFILNEKINESLKEDGKK